MFPTIEGVEFRGIKGFPGYCVGDDGSIWSKKYGSWRRRVLRSCDDMHLGIGLCHNNKRYYFPVHKLVLEAFVGPCPEGMEACHNNGDSYDNRLCNLRWDTHLNNVHDKIKHGTIARGVRTNLAKLVEDEVREIRRLCANGLSQKVVAQRYGVDQTQVSNIVRRKSWAHVA